ncbi:hypothetical protein MTO96_024501 [Rhipicephalus appendiculatus]
MTRLGTLDISKLERGLMTTSYERVVGDPGECASIAASGILRGRLDTAPDVTPDATSRAGASSPVASFGLLAQVRSGIDELCFMLTALELTSSALLQCRCLTVVDGVFRTKRDGSASRCCLEHSTAEPLL